MSESDFLDLDDVEGIISTADLAAMEDMSDEEFGVHLSKVLAEPTPCERLAPVLKGVMAVELARLVLPGDTSLNPVPVGVTNA